MPVIDVPTERQVQAAQNQRLFRIPNENLRVLPPGSAGPTRMRFRPRPSMSSDRPREHSGAEPNGGPRRLVAVDGAAHLPSADQQIAVRIGSRQGGLVAAAHVNEALASLASDLNSATIGALGAALRNAVETTAPELRLTESQAIALLAQIRHARPREALTPLGIAISRALDR